MKRGTVVDGTTVGSVQVEDGVVRNEETKEVWPKRTREGERGPENVTDFRGGDCGTVVENDRRGGDNGEEEMSSWTLNVNKLLRIQWETLHSSRSSRRQGDGGRGDGGTNRISNGVSSTG